MKKNLDIISTISLNEEKQINQITIFPVATKYTENGTEEVKYKSPAFHSSKTKFKLDYELNCASNILRKFKKEFCLTKRNWTFI